MPLLPGELLIDDDFKDTDKLMLFDPDGAGVRGRGQEPRDWEKYPQEMFASPDEMPLIPESEYAARCKEMAKEESLLSNVRMKWGPKGGMVPTLDQGQKGYCWSHSTTMTAMIDRAVRMMPFVALSAYMVAVIIKKGRDEGGWCGLSADFGRNVGFAPQALWPQGAMSLGLDTPEMRAVAANYKIVEDWVDLTKAVYDQNLTMRQIATCLMSGIPCALDFNWWGHSVCALDWVEVEPGSYGIRILNSWGNGWGENGTSVLRGSKMIADGAIATRALRMAA